MGRLGPEDRAAVEWLYDLPEQVNEWTASVDQLKLLRERAQEALELIAAKRAALEQALTAAEMREVSRCANHIHQAYELHITTKTNMVGIGPKRDQMMAQNVRWLTDEARWLSRPHRQSKRLRRLSDIARRE